MQISFNPKDPRDVAEVVNVLRLLNAIDAAVRVIVDDEPTLSFKEAREIQKRIDNDKRAENEHPIRAVPDLDSLLDGLNFGDE